MKKFVIAALITLASVSAYANQTIGHFLDNGNCSVELTDVQYKNQDLFVAHRWCNGRQTGLLYSYSGAEKRIYIYSWKQEPIGFVRESDITRGPIPQYDPEVAKMMLQSYMIERAIERGIRRATW